MRFPWLMNFNIMRYLVRMRLQGRTKFPIVLMLEPLHKCNLACEGCGRILEYEETIDEYMSYEQCMKAVDEVDTPVVTVTGGEPLIHPQIVEILHGIVKRRKFINCCTNALLLHRVVPKLKRTPFITFNVHIDGLEETHDRAVSRQGVFKKAIEGIKIAKAKGFRIVTNTTVFKYTPVQELEDMCEYLTGVGVDGFLLAPAFKYTALDSPAAANCMDRGEIAEKFRTLDRLAKKYPLWSTPIYVDFLQGKRPGMECTPWGNPVVNPQGWKGPCYLITDAHYKSFQEMVDSTRWQRYGVHSGDPRCTNCAMHCGFEPTVVMNSDFRDTLRLMKWNFFG